MGKHLTITLHHWQESFALEYRNTFPVFSVQCLRNNHNIEQPNKLIKLRVNSNEAYEAFLVDLQTCDFTTLLDHTSHGDPNQNYDKLHHKLSELKCKHLRWKPVKFNKNNRWITDGIIKSIKYRDKLYRNFKNASTDSLSYVELKNRLSDYNKRLKKTIREANYIYNNPRDFVGSRRCGIRALDFFPSLCDWTGIAAAALPSCLSDFGATRSTYTTDLGIPGIWRWGFLPRSRQGP